MSKYPGESVYIEFENRKRTDDELTDAITVEIKVRDPAGNLRVNYDASNLSKVSTGHYRYVFVLPDSVMEGEWYAEIHSGIDDDIDIKKVSFAVEE